MGLALEEFCGGAEDPMTARTGRPPASGVDLRPGVTGRGPRARLATARDRAAALAYKLGWKVVCHIPRPWGEWAFRQVADWLWRRRGIAVQRLEANLARVVRAAQSRQ